VEEAYGIVQGTSMFGQWATDEQQECFDLRDLYDIPPSP
jgi:hypothetical protein